MTDSTRKIGEWKQYALEGVGRGLYGPEWVPDGQPNNLG